MDFVDYYKTLDVPVDADTATIKKSYRKLARRYHPDVSKEKNAEEQFKLVSEAWNVLKSTEKRAEYDQLRLSEQQAHRARGPRTTGQSGGNNYSSSSFDFDDSLSDIFSGYYPNQGFGAQTRHSEERFSVQGQDIHAKISVTLQDAFHRSTLPLKIQMPVVHQDGTIRSEEKQLNVTLPQGITNGQKIRLKDQGGPPIGSGKSGDLILEVNIAPDNVFLLDGYNVTVNTRIAPWEAALGAKIEVPTLGGTVTITIPENATQGQTLRLKGRGLPGKPVGDQLVVLSIVYPKAVSEEQKKHYKEMKSAWPDFMPRKLATKVNG